MKKLIYLLMIGAFSLTSTTIFAQEVKEAQETVQDKVEVQLSDLPEAVTKALGENFAGYTAEKAYKIMHNEKEIYYVYMVKDDESIRVIIDADGNIQE
ncbi:MAG: hypothetical protein L3J08_00625 [Flavobacteriaceae bacterium]|nr:hypothetical protein [Flavobacteriaceae bacterium]